MHIRRKRWDVKTAGHHEHMSAKRRKYRVATRQGSVSFELEDASIKGSHRMHMEAALGSSDTAADSH